MPFRETALLVNSATDLKGIADKMVEFMCAGKLIGMGRLDMDLNL